MTERISLRQLFFITFMTRSTVVISILSIVTAYDIRQDAWLSALVVIGVGPAITWTIMTLARQFPNETFIDYTPRVLGTVLGKVVGLYYLFFLAHYLALTLRVFGETLVAPIFPETPLVVIISLMALIVVFAVRYGIEVIARLSELFVVPFILAAVIVVAASATIWDVGWVLPVMAEGLQPVLLGAVTPAALFVENVFLLMLTPHLSDITRARSVVTWASFWSGVFNLIVAMAILLSFGPFEMHRLPLPIYYLARIITLGSFYERVEVLPLAAWSLAFVIHLSIVSHAFVKGVAQWFGVKRHTFLTLPLGVTIICLSFLVFVDSTQLRTFQHPSALGFFLLVFVFPIVLITLLVASLRKTQPKATVQQEDAS